jgi:hypothetical protein
MFLNGIVWTPDELFELAQAFLHRQPRRFTAAASHERHGKKMQIPVQPMTQT